MSIHEDIQQTMRQAIVDLDGSRVVHMSPTLIANQTYEQYGRDDDVHVRYAAIEHYKQMARRLLGEKYDPEGAENDAHQGDMFSGLLQQRYPIPRRADEEPIYIPLAHLTTAQLDWNIMHLRKSADARLKHADALQAYRDQQRRA